MTATLRLSDDGSVCICDRSGAALPANLQAEARRQQRDVILEWLVERCAETNQQIQVIEQIHFDTPPPETERPYAARPFDLAPPDPQKRRALGILGRIFNGVRRRIEGHNATLSAAYDANVVEWKEKKAVFDAIEEARRRVIEGDGSDTQAMEVVLEDVLHRIDWPRETTVSFDIGPTGQTVFLDIDVPEIEELPRSEATVNKRGLSLAKKELSDTRLRQVYLTHIHGVGFRVVGETFHALPTVQRVTVSGYSQRKSRVTGRLGDEYLYSVAVGRQQWSLINFSDLPAVDVVESLGAFEIRRKMTKTGILSRIEPLAPT